MSAGAMWLSGACCAGGALLMGAGGFVSAARLGCAAVGIFAEAAAFDLLYIYTAELFPTVVRNASLGCVTVAGQLGAMAAPVVVATGGRLPFAVFGACGMAAGGLGWFLPETFNRPMYDTMEGLEGGEGKKVLIIS
ncbi:Organic cation/carnitine transporter 4 [Apostasia shenzhenica]|uniref:Organic cation/carnitine transporter 4 n=1 Tax=Apostasia shenzhenica TaxID=1088818 RepID=A0A2I0ADD0_9ASPA|nr:Organic cation/carnitine transporter 4 [Apostasia shenzhenica]